MAHLSAAIGAHNASGMFFEREWERNQDSKHLYFALDRYIVAHNHKKVAELGEIFLEHEDFAIIIAEVNEQWEERAKNADGTFNILNLVSWANEESRIKTAYTVALIRTDRADDALDQLNVWLEEFIEMPNLRHPNHAFIDAFRLDERVEPLLASYVEELEEIMAAPYSPFAVDFLWEAYARLGNPVKTKQYAELFYGLL